MKLLKPLLEKIAGPIRRVIAWTKERIDVLIKSIGSRKDAVGYLKAGGVLLLAVAVLLVLTGLICGFVLFCVSVPGLIYGTILWLVWTLTGMGVQLFPQLDVQWPNLTWAQFFWNTAGLYWLFKMFTKGKQPPILNNSK